MPKAASPETIVNGFRASGIHPLDISIFSDTDFTSGYVTDIQGGTITTQVSQEDVFMVTPVGHVTEAEGPCTNDQIISVMLSENWRKLHEHLRSHGRELSVHEVGHFTNMYREYVPENCDVL